jgi:DNA-directed RNA polymerase subunit beta'
VDELFTFFTKAKKTVKYKQVRISIASPDKINEWSYGEVKKPETINYRTFKPERDGLFCAKIFGPVKDFECNCGKYKRMKHRGVVCEKCGVEVIQSKVRRERLGHISLAAPVAHIWFLKSLPSKIGNLCDMTLKELEKVLYFDSYVVVTSTEPSIVIGSLMNEEAYRTSREEFPGQFTVGIGASAIQTILKNLDLDPLALELREDMRTTGSEAKRKKYAKRLNVVEAFRDSGNKPEWMILEVIPVLPPDLRPLVPLEGGRFATSDLNDLYRRVINRNNRLKRLLDLDAPEIIIRNEKRMLQEAVDVLFDNGRRGKTITGPNKRPLKSLSDMLKGKQGRFRQNLLGKRVDYSGRTVIVVGPHLRLHQCGLPKKMALELFKPFIYNKLEGKGFVTTIKSARKMVEKGTKEVWDVLDEVVQEYPIILNRAPTLHRLGMQAFEPVLIEGKALQLHPLVCSAFNADFDGDQMAVHLPLTVEAQMEARVLMMSTNNILSPAHGEPIIIPSQDIVLGLYYMTRERHFVKGHGKMFSSAAEACIAYDYEQVHLQAMIKVRMDGKMVDTTMGRVLVGNLLPKSVPFEHVNQNMGKKALAKIIDYAYRHAGTKDTVILADRLKDLGYEFATQASVSICIDNMRIPSTKATVLGASEDQVMDVENQYADGLITAGEKYNKVVDIWSKTTDTVAQNMMDELSVLNVEDPETKEVFEVPSFNPIYMMADSGARGSKDQIRQLAGMRGLMAKPSGAIIETPIKANFREGLTVLEYFISTHGARKGLADTALKTANSGYLTRRLVDVAQDSTIIEDDCRTLDGILAESLVEGGEIIQKMAERILGRVALDDVVDAFSGEVLCEANTEFTEEKVAAIEAAGLDRVMMRSVLTCRAKRGVCAKCYGRDLGRGHMVNSGESVGIIAAQSIGEPGTQLTMRTFHIGGAASRATEVAEVRTQHGGFLKYNDLYTVESADGYLVVMNRNADISVVGPKGRERERYPVPYGAILHIADGGEMQENDLIADWDPYTIPIVTEMAGVVKFEDIIEGSSMQEKKDQITGRSSSVIIPSKTSALNPLIALRNDKGKPIKLPKIGIPARYSLPVGTILGVQDGDEVKAGMVLGKIPRETTKTKDITGGLPRVAELFEVRKPKKHAVITEIDGRISFGKELKGKRRVLVTPELGAQKEYLIPKGKHISVHEGDFVKSGETLMDGSPDPNDILRVLGVKELAKFMVNEIQEVYRLQGVKINDKHIEVIVRQMLRRVQITTVGDSTFMQGQQVEWWRFNEENEQLFKDGYVPAQAEAVLLGVTKASLSTDSFISAASFQETTKVLTNASMAGRIDDLSGLKENVIMGRLVPAGTGLAKYRI